MLMCAYYYHDVAMASAWYKQTYMLLYTAAANSAAAAMSVMMPMTW